MIKIFISYSSQQRDFARNVASEVGLHNVYIDELVFDEGNPIIDEIRKKLSDSSIYVILFSLSAIESNWVNKEIEIAKSLYEIDSLKIVLPFLIDDGLEAIDRGIPNWIRRDFVVRKIRNYKLIAKVIDERIREVTWRLDPVIKARETIFEGRESIFNELKRNIYDQNRSKKRVVIASGQFGVGRSRFLKEFIVREIKKNEYYRPNYIELESRDSIEKFIYYINDILLEYSTDNINEIAREKSMEEKVEKAILLLNKLFENKEVLIIRDNGACITPYRDISKWFLKIINNEKLGSGINIFLASKFKPASSNLQKHLQISTINLNPLEKTSLRILFFRYAQELDLEEHIDDNEVDFFISRFKGLPDQVFQAVHRIKNEGLIVAKEQINQIIEIGDAQILSLLKEVESQKPGCLQIIVLLSNFEIISYDLFKRLSSSYEFEEYLIFLHGYSIFENFGGFNQYMKINPMIADYVKRSKIRLDEKYRSKLESIATDFFNNEYKDNFDLSQLLFSVKNYVLQRQRIPDEYFIPGLILSSVVELYYAGKYMEVISICDKILIDAPSKLDEILIWEAHYWLCLSLCRVGDGDRFFKEVRFFEQSRADNPDKLFLLGFFFRMKRDWEKAEFYYDKVLEEFERNAPVFKSAGKTRIMSKVKRELVIVYMHQGKYPKALSLAEDNYFHSKDNIFHIDAYFKCLVRKHNLSFEDRNMLLKLIKEIEISYDFRKSEMKEIMDAEYLFFVTKDSQGAFNKLKTTIERYPHKGFAAKSLAELQFKQDMKAASQETINRYREEIELVETFEQ